MSETVQPSPQTLPAPPPPGPADATPRALPDLARLAALSESGSLDEQLTRMAETTAAMLGAAYCSIMLVEDSGPGGPRLAVCGASGNTQFAPDRENAGKPGLAARVLAAGQAVRIDDIGVSPFADLARRPDDPRRSLMCAPIRMQRAALGVVNVSGRIAAGPFEADELRLLEVIALFIGKAIELSQLRSMLDSRFAQMAVIQEAARGLGQSLAAGLPNPDQVAKIMAKSFYKEMTRAGFGSRQIINAASEIITQLSGNLQRHTRRLGRDASSGGRDEDETGGDAAIDDAGT